jgi:hypothetical protein
MSADAPQKQKTVLEKFKDGFVSPLKDIRVRYFIDYSGNQADPREIWLYPNKKGAKGLRLYSFGRDAAAYFSPDEHWIVVHDAAGSNESFIVLFERIDGIKYQRSLDPNPQAQHLLEQETGIPEIWEKFHHRYFIFRKWAEDSNSFVIVLHGYADLSDPSLDDWFCTFDLQTMKAYLTPEQREKNKGAVHFKKQIKTQQ